MLNFILMPSTFILVSTCCPAATPKRTADPLLALYCSNSKEHCEILCHLNHSTARLTEYPAPGVLSLKGTQRE